MAIGTMTRRLASVAGALLLAGMRVHGAAAQLLLEPLALEHGVESEGAERYVVISLSEHRLYLMEGPDVLWQAVVGTGTGTRLEGAGQKWEFSTPRGMFRLQRKEKNPR